MLRQLAIALVTAVSLGVAAIPTGPMAAMAAEAVVMAGAVVMAEAAALAADTASAEVPAFPGAECPAATRL
jgi:hypothetical protein